MKDGSAIDIAIRGTRRTLVAVAEVVVARIKIGLTGEVVTATERWTVARAAVDRIA